jgi:hypothetical protein
MGFEWFGVELTGVINQTMGVSQCRLQLQEFVDLVCLAVLASGDDPPSGGASSRGNLKVVSVTQLEIATSRPRSVVETRDDWFEGFQQALTSGSILMD